MDKAQPDQGPAINRLHYAKNIVGLIGFIALFLYCVFLLLTTSKPNGLLVYAIAMFVLLLTIIRSARRVMVLRRILSDGKN